MNFSDIVKILKDDLIDYNIKNDYKISSIEYDSRKITKSSIFVAVTGDKVDGHRYISKSIENGALGVILEKEENFDYNFVKVKNSRIALAKVAYEFYKKDILQLKLFAVTGTNGKTSIANIVYQYLKAKLDVAGVIGTMKYIIGNREYEAINTTPESKTFYELLSFAAKCIGATKAVITEASSHSLVLNRLFNIEFDVTGFTNLTRDHLDFHKNMHDYYLAKKILFEKHMKKDGVAVFNIDDEYGLKLFNDSSINQRKYSVSTENSDSDFFVKHAEFSEDYTEFELIYNLKSYVIRTRLIGEFNLFNMTLAIAMLVASGEKINNVIEYIPNVKPIKGRFEKVLVDKKIHVIVDYAHTPDALENVLKSVLKIAKRDSNIITVFGAGGDRDRGKRPLMREAAQKFSDYVVITSDNPRTEDPKIIINDILKDNKDENFCVEEDRMKAIIRALNYADNDDWVVIAGKGHEDYQIIGNEKIYFSDQKIVNEWGKHES